MTIQVAHQQLAPHHQFLAQSSRSEVHIKHLVLYIDVYKRQETAGEKGVEGWVFTLQAPSYGPFLTYADSRDLRRELYMACLLYTSPPIPRPT